MPKELTVQTSPDLVVRDLNLARRAENIRRIVAGSIVEVGRELIAAQHEAGSQEVWERWVVHDVQITVKYAYRVMNTADMAELGHNDVSNLSNSVLLRIAEPSMPTKAVEQVIERAASGEKVSVRVAEEIIAQAKAEAKAEQLAADREELRKALQQSNDRVTNMQAVVDRATADRRAAEKQVAELEQRMATGPSQRLKQELEDAQDKLHNKQREIDSLSTDLISERNRVRQLQLARQTSDAARDMRRLFSDACTRATAALVEVAGYDIDTDYFIESTWNVLDTLKAQMGRTGMMLASINRDMVEADYIDH